MAYNDRNVTMEDVRLIFRNFSGKKGQYNAEGLRNFGVLLDEKNAAAMLRDGWNVKVLKAREEDDVDQAWLKVTAKYRNMAGETVRPPRVVMITSRGRTNLDEDTIGILDYANILTVDLIVRPFEYNVSGKTGISAYLQAIYVTIEEDALELKYADMDPKTDPDELEFQ